MVCCSKPLWPAQGKIAITPMKHQAHPLCKHYLSAAQSIGLPLNEDFNGSQFEGAGIYDINVRQGQRDSSNTAYLKPALKRANLTLFRETIAEKIIFENNSACAVQINKAGISQRISANKEIIIAAGAVDSPKLLQLSGVGDKTTLEKHQIPIIQHLPAVGQNLQDHLCVSYYYKANISTLNDELGPLLNQIKAGAKYLFNRSGPLSLSVNQAGGFFKGADTEQHANIQLYFNPMSYQIPKDPKAQLKPDPYSGFLIAFNSCRPSSKGSVDIAGPDYRQPPLIKPNYLSTEKDIQEVLQGHRIVQQLMQSDALKAITAEQISPSTCISDDSAVLQYFRENAGSIYHLCGTCKMGVDASDAVVDNRLRVYGVQNLRVIDASIFPTITSANINAPVMMVAEKGAQMILEDTQT